MLNLLPPRVGGPLSECSRAATVTNVTPGATVTLAVTRSGVQIVVGHAVVNGSSGVVRLDAAAALVAHDLVNAKQEAAPDASDFSTDGPEVQTSVAVFGPPQVLSHLWSCSRSFALGGMRPGTQVQVLQGGSAIGTGEAIDGTCWVGVPGGLPSPGVALTARQLICPKPPPPPPSSGYVVDSALPAVLPFPVQAPRTIPAPQVLQGLTACSRAVQVGSILPGADVVLEGARGWWASLGGSDLTSAWVQLTVQLEEGEHVTIRQEVSPHCELTPDRRELTVGPQQKLGKPRLYQIDCNTSPTVFALDLKPEADVEFSVTSAGVETIYHTQATVLNDGLPPTLPAPPMPPGAVVKVRQGECGLWSDWSDAQTANAMTKPPQTPKIPHTLFSCQDAVPVENVWPLSGYLRLMSATRGEVCRVPTYGNAPILPVAPSLSVPDQIWVEHHVCGYAVPSDRKEVQPPDVNVVPGQIQGPLFDGDTGVVVRGVVAGAHLEVWETTGNRFLWGGRAPFADTPLTDVAISGFGALHAGWQVVAKTLHCGQFVQTPSATVVFRAPTLASISPTGVVAGHAAFPLTAAGTNFLPGARVQWNGADRPTTFVSSTQLHAAVAATDVAAAKNNTVRVVNPDGQATGTLTFTVNAPPPATLTLNVDNQSGGNFSVASASWDVWQQSVSGYTHVGTYTGAPATVTPPGPGYYVVHADVWAVRKATGDTELAEFSVPQKGPGSVPVWPVTMAGANASHTFHLMAKGDGTGLYDPIVVA